MDRFVLIAILLIIILITLGLYVEYRVCSKHYPNEIIECMGSRKYRITNE